MVENTHKKVLLWRFHRDELYRALVHIWNVGTSP